MKNINSNEILNTKDKAPKKANIGKTVATAALLTLAGVVHGQNSATIDPKHYKTPETAFAIPNLPSGSNFYLNIKAGEEVYITIDGIDPNSGSFYLGSGNTKTINGNIIKVSAGDVGNWLVNYKEKGVDKTIGLHTNYQADIYNRTPGSATENIRPEAIIVDPGKEATLNAGPNFNPDGGTKGYYKWKNINDEFFTGGYTDSTRVVGAGSYILRTNDGSGLTTGYTNDTIAVVERPTPNQGTQSLDFANTVEGVTYKFYKFEPVVIKTISNNAPMQTQTDSTWVEVPALSFVGNGGQHSVGTGIGLWRIGVQRTANTDAVQDNKTVEIDLGTDVIEISSPKTNFVVEGQKVVRSENVEYYIYDISGRIIDSGYGTSGSVKTPGIYIVRSKDEKGNKQTNKIAIR